MVAIVLGPNSEFSARGGTNRLARFGPIESENRPLGKGARAVLPIISIGGHTFVHSFVWRAVVVVSRSRVCAQLERAAGHLEGLDLGRSLWDGRRPIWNPLARSLPLRSHSPGPLYNCSHAFKTTTAATIVTSKMMRRLARSSLPQAAVCAIQQQLAR